jgi:hypothetical protein
MRELSLIAAIVTALAATIVLAQEELKPAAPPPAAAEPASPPPAAAEPAGAPAARANPFSPLDSGAAPAPGSSSLPTVETSPAQADAVSQTATPAAAKLNGILYCESKPLVVINDLIAGVGDEVAGMRVTAIARDKVTLAGPRGVWVMTPLQPEARPAPANALEPGAGAPGHVPHPGTCHDGEHARRLPPPARSEDGGSGAANPAPAVPPAPAEAGKPAVGPEAAASAESQVPEAAGGTPVVAAETTDQPIGKENQ